MDFKKLCNSNLCKVVFLCVVAYLVWHFFLRRVVREGVGAGGFNCKHPQNEGKPCDSSGTFCASESRVCVGGRCRCKNS